MRTESRRAAGSMRRDASSLPRPRAPTIKDSRWSARRSRSSTRTSSIETPPAHRRTGAAHHRARAQSGARRGAPHALDPPYAPPHDPAGGKRPQRREGTGDRSGRLQRSGDALRRACALDRVAGADRRGTDLPEWPVLLSRVGRGVPQRLDPSGPHLRPIPGRRGACPYRDGRTCPPGRARPAHRPAEARGTMIRLENLTKLYGSFVAVDDISLHVPRGVLYGCLGPNGAGKTTTLRMIAGILRPTQGRVLLGGDDIHVTPLSAKMRLRFLPGRAFRYDKLTGGGFLRVFARPYGEGGGSGERRHAGQLEGVELAGREGGVIRA